MYLENQIANKDIHTFSQNGVYVMEQKKRVNCLYRVSTIGQVEKDDIPMQRQFCREFIASHPDWVLQNEFYEKGVSGFKKSAKERDAMQELQQEAVAGSFDILLVYMFDRLGRRDDETPFVVEWFVRNGVEVWSAVEGQQRFDNHVDKLLNYIRYWQASGESIKTSVRVKTRMEQLTKDGCFTGGIVPFGYKLQKQGRINKKNQEVNDFVIDEDAAEIVRFIFYKYVNEGCGAQRISHYLLENGIRRADGSMIPNTTIVRMIKNKLYMGVISNGNAESEIIPELQIVDEATFQRAQELMEKRTTHHADTPLNLRGSSLLVGNIFCGHCKNRLTLTTSGKKYIRKDGTVRNQVKSRYQCHFKARHPDLCDGQSGYGVIKLDEIVDALVRYQLSRIRVSAKDSLIAEQHEKATALARSRYKMSAMRLEEKQKELSDYEAETINVIRGKSRLNVDLLNSLVAKCKEEIAELSQEVDAQKADMEHQLESAAQEQAEFEKLESWADLYDNCTFEAKKMIVSQLIKAVYVYRDYRLEVEFRVSFDDFRRLCVGCEPNGGRIATVESALILKDTKKFGIFCKNQKIPNILVDLKRLELSTSRMRTERSPS